MWISLSFQRTITNMPNKLEGLVNLTGSVKHVFVGRYTVTLLRSQFLTWITLYWQHHCIYIFIIEKFPLNWLSDSSCFCVFFHATSTSNFHFNEFKFKFILIDWVKKKLLVVASLRGECKTRVASVKQASVRLKKKLKKLCLICRLVVMVVVKQSFSKGLVWWTNYMLWTSQWFNMFFVKSLQLNCKW